MKKSRKPTKNKPKHKPKSIPHAKWRLIPLFIFISVLAAFAWYRSVVTVPSINLADGLDAEEAAFLKKSVSVDKKKNSTGIAPAPVVKVTVKDKKTGEEYTSKVVLKNIDEPDKADVTTLTAAITKTVIENNTPVQPSPSPLASGITVAESGTACGNIADGQWAQTGKKYQSQGGVECTATSACSADIYQCVQCKGGKLDLSKPEVCGKFEAINYIRDTSDKVKAPCYDNKLMYADSTYLEQKGYCVNGEWAAKPRPVTPKNDLETKEQEFLAEARRVDELHLTPSIAPSTKKDIITPPAQNPASIQVTAIDTPQSINSTLFSNRDTCEEGIDLSKEQCDALPGGGFGRVPKVENKTFTPFEFGSATAGKKSDGSDSPQNSNSQNQACNPLRVNSCGVGTCEFSGWDGLIPTWGCVYPVSEVDVGLVPVTDGENSNIAQSKNIINSQPIANNPVVAGFNKMLFGEEPVLAPVIPKDKYVYYNQKDEQWEKEFFICNNGSKVPFKQVSCGQTALAILLSTYVDPSYTPVKVKNEYFEYGGYCGGSGASPILDILEEKGFIVTRNPQEKDLPNLIKEGKIIWAGIVFYINGKRITHHTIITGITSEGKYIFQDPWYGPDVVLSEIESYGVLGFSVLTPPESRNIEGNEQNASTSIGEQL